MTKPLTPREGQVLRLIWDGLTSKQIAERLKLSPRTVDVHRIHLMKRMGVYNTAQLIRAGLHSKLIHL